MMRVRMEVEGKNMIKVRELFRDDWMNMVDKWQAANYSSNENAQHIE